MATKRLEVCGGMDLHMYEFRSKKGNIGKLIYLHTRPESTLTSFWIRPTHKVLDDFIILTIYLFKFLFFHSFNSFISTIFNFKCLGNKVMVVFLLSFPCNAALSFGSTWTAFANRHFVQTNRQRQRRRRQNEGEEQIPISTYLVLFVFIKVPYLSWFRLVDSISCSFC
jgi:hypothetical protein